MKSKTEKNDIRDRLTFYTSEEELLNRVTHGLGALLSVVGLVFLLTRPQVLADGWRLFSCAIYCGTLVIFYLMSTIYHTVRSPGVKYVFRIMDHASIYLVIAGTYTPFALVSLRATWGWTIFIVIWVLAIAGTVLKLFMTHRLRILGPLLYIAMGWLIVIPIKPLLAAVPLAGIVWLFAGGLAYTLGVAFYAWEALHNNHAIWHLFVLAGSACHYVAIYGYVALT
jgi:hemolysin III